MRDVRRHRQGAATRTSSSVRPDTAAPRAVPRPRGGAADDRPLLAQTLEALRPDGWVTLHQVPWPGRPAAAIAHISIGPGGVVVVEDQDWSGTTTLVDGLLRHDGLRRDLEVEHASAATAQVTALLAPAHRSAARAVLCLSRQDRTPATARGGVVVVGHRQVAGTLRALPHRLSPADVAGVAAHLGRQMVGTAVPQAATGVGAQLRRQLHVAVMSPTAAGGHAEHSHEAPQPHDAPASQVRRPLLERGDRWAIGAVAVLALLPELGTAGRTVGALLRGLVG